MAVAQGALPQHRLTMEPKLPDRPQSALARGVQITEFKETSVNPEPIIIEETDLLMEQYLSPRKLRLLTGVDNLEDVHCLEMKVNTSETSLGNFGGLLPKLSQLRLSNSVINSIRDLGSSLRSLKVLWMSRCGLQELDGISSMSSLKEIYLSYNDINDISSLSMLDNLQIIDLEGNNIDDIGQLQYLALCQNLTSLTLEGNPVCVASPVEDEDEDYDYRQAVKKAIPQLKYLDEELLIEGEITSRKHNVFDDDWAYLEELQKDAAFRGSSDSLASEGSSRPNSGAVRPSTGYRPGTALRPNTGFRPLTASRRPATTVGVRPGTANPPGTASSRPGSGDASDADAAASDLTLGKVICGNPSKALMSRRKPGAPAATETTVNKIFPQFQHKPEHTYDALPDEERDMSEILEELKTWRLHHEKRMIEIKESKEAPQVLVIDHDDSVSLSDDGSGSEVDSDEENLEDDFNLLELSNTQVSKYEPKHMPKVQKGIRLHSPKESDNINNVHVNDEAEMRLSWKHSGLKHDESFNIDVESPFSAPFKSMGDRTILRGASPVHPQPPRAQSLNALRSQSPIPSAVLNDRLLPTPPALGVPRHRARLEQDMEKSITSENLQPVIRGVPDRPVPPSHRPATARAALALPSQPRIRRQLPQVPSLPSKPAVPKH